MSDPQYLIMAAIYCSAAVGVLACLISESVIMAPLRNRLNWDVLYCPVCLGFWIALPALAAGPLFYFAVVGFSNAWMLLILKVYRELDEAADTEEETDETSQTP